MLKTTIVYFFHSNKNKILKGKLAFVPFSNFSFHSFFHTSHIQSISYFASWTSKKYIDYDFSLTAPLQAESRSLTKSSEECRETQGMEHQGKSKHCPIWERKDNFYSVCLGLFPERRCSHCMLKTTMDLERRAVTGLRDACQEFDLDWGTQPTWGTPTEEGRPRNKYLELIDFSTSILCSPLTEPHLKSAVHRAYWYGP